MAFVRLRLGVAALSCGMGKEERESVEAMLVA
jgi:hypothetical protein